MGLSPFKWTSLTKKRLLWPKKEEEDNEKIKRSGTRHWNKQEHVGRNENLSKKKKAPIEDGGTYINQSNYK